MPTRQDVALLAGVSGATVSRVYNSPAQVEPSTVERVRAAAAELGFVPDRHAAALRRKTSSTLLLVEIEGGETYRWTDQRVYQSLYGEIIRRLLHHLQATPWNLQLVTLASVADVPSLAARDFAGVLGLDIARQDWADALAALGKPVVCAHHGDHLTGVSTVTTDNRAGGRLQGEWLRSQGCRAVAYVSGHTTEVRSHAERRAGFVEVFPAATLLETGVGIEAGRAAAAVLTPRLRDGTFQGIACVNDLTAVGLLQGLTTAGLPDKLAVIGYDNLVLTGLVAPGLATVEAHLPELYEQAMDALISQVRGGNPVNLQTTPELASR